jgi:helicase required for RNAi-mediated heterochromatin assembly 1
MSTFHFQYGHPPKERVKPVNPDIRQYYNPDLPVYGPWKLWQTKPELPSAEEILGTDVPGDVVTLPSNFVWGPWFFKEKYLETHYELIREDSVTPLRNAVGQVRADPFMNDTAGISIYEKVSTLIQM